MECANSTTPRTISAADTGSPTVSSSPAGRSTSNSTTPASALAAGSVIVIAVSAVGSDPLANESCTSNAPPAADPTRHSSGQSSTGSLVTTTTSTAVTQKQQPAPTATSAVRTWAASRRATTRIVATTATTTSTNSATDARDGTLWRTPPRSSTSVATPAQTATVPTQSRGDGRIPRRYAVSIRATISCTTRMAWTAAIDPRCSASACAAKPATLSNQPASQPGSRRSRPSSPSTGSQSARPRGPRRRADDRAAPCCSTVETANSTAASSARRYGMATPSPTEVNAECRRGTGSRTPDSPASPVGRAAAGRQHGRVLLLKAPFTRRAWRELGYIWATLPLSVFGLVVVYGMLTPILPLTWAFLPWLGRWVGTLYRGLARRVLRIDIAPPAPAPAPDRPGALGWMFAKIRDGAGWRAAGYALFRLPYAIVMLYLGVLWWAYGLLGIADPLLRWVDRRYFPEGAPHFGVTFGHVVPAGWLVFAAGVVLFFSAPWVVHGLVRLDTYLMSRLLGRRHLEERVRDLEETRALAVDDAAATLRRIERDLHDGAQARLVALAMDLTMMRDRLREPAPDLAATRQLVDTAHAHAKEAIGELRDLARGIHPPVLDRGLAEALQTLAARSPVPVVLSVDLPRRPAPAIETIAYYCASELLTNVARHSAARQATVDVVARDGALELRVRDDGVGGAAPANGGTGLSGLTDRVRTVDGTLTVSSPVGGPTVVTVRLPWSL